MEPGSSLPCSQQLLPCPYPEPEKSMSYTKPVSWRSMLIPFHVHLDLPSGLFPLGLPTKTLYAPLLSNIHATCPTHLILLVLITRNDIWWVVQLLKLLTMHSSPLPCYLVPLRPKYLPQHPIMYNDMTSMLTCQHAEPYQILKTLLYT
jgi:hypothetical protein